MRLILVVTTLATALSACGPMNPRVSEIDFGSAKRDYVYDDSGLLVEMVQSSDGGNDRTTTFTYDGTRLDEVEVVQENSPTTTYTFNHDGDLLEGVAIDYGANDETATIEHQYDGALLEETDVEFDFGDLRITYNTKYFYSDGKLTSSEVESVTDFGILGSATSTTSQTLTWDGAQLTDAERTTEDNGETTTDDFAFSYNSDNRLDNIEGEGFDVDINYDDNGRIASYDGTDDDGAFDVEYTYEDGAVNGVQFTPLHAFGDLFDLGGQAFGTPHNKSRAVLVVGF